MFLVTGTGRCGTTWACEALRATGLRVGHQDRIKHRNVLAGRWSLWGVDGEVSYEAAPLARVLASAGVRVVLLRRALNG